jgi:glycosyltransferase involved in cell wall biosynthesis
MPPILHDQTPPRLAVFVKGWPRLSETFIAQELFALQERGVPFVIVRLRRPHDTRCHPLHTAITAPVIDVPEYLHDDPWMVLGALGRAERYRTKEMLRFLPLVGKALVRNPSRASLRRVGQALVAASLLPPSITAVYAHFLHSPATVAWYTARLLGVPWAASAHAKDIYTSTPEELRDKLHAAAWVTTCTAQNKAYLERLAPAGLVRLNYHGLDEAKFPPPPPRPDGQAAPLHIVSIGRLVAKKGIDDTLRALAGLSDGMPWRFSHLGGGDDVPYRALAESLGIAKKISWLGSGDSTDVLGLLRSGDIFILSSRPLENGDQDGLPNVLLEAGSQNLAVVSTTAGAIPELITSGIHGLLAAPGDVPGLTTALQQMATDTSLRQRLGQALGARVRSEFSHAGHIQPLLHLLETLGA